MALDTTLPARIVELVRAHGWEEGQHLGAQTLADALDVSRSPVNAALQVLYTEGLLRREPNRGYFVAPGFEAAAAARAADGAAMPYSSTDALYQRIANDRLQGSLPDSVTSSLLRKTYAATQGDIDSVLARIGAEGWAQKKPGYGWTFSPMLTTPDSLLQSYRMRLALEPAALLEPGYHLDPALLARCKAVERDLLDGGIERASAQQLHERGVRFHETLVEASGNAFFIDAVRRVNRVRRLLSYRSTQDRARYRQHARQHLHVLALLEKGRNAEAAEAMREHLQSTLRNIAKLRGLLAPKPASASART